MRLQGPDAPMALLQSLAIDPAMPSGLRRALRASGLPASRDPKALYLCRFVRLRSEGLALANASDEASKGAKYSPSGARSFAPGGLGPKGGKSKSPPWPLA